eukprot:CAMPEP_0206453152 /NCGR_PEP_ID=MMETSP0324_2-20121206/20368_1 /ASSEMBLY_ACC=CAM_ASM_000836 /TAXON_ID=2866 /ORGANISM="Crypthecodinium cohnii, Strain Seligo" /LENGTH=68 /DNA_ID=CAMNT_0053923373 /DNA_START=222 /DNA_END=424 /DNA_ORIENTATION=+
MTNNQSSLPGSVVGERTETLNVITSIILPLAGISPDLTTRNSEMRLEIELTRLVGRAPLSDPYMWHNG